MPLALCACNGPAGTAARQYTLHYLGRRHPDADVFQRLAGHLLGNGSVAPLADVNAGRPRTVWTPTNEDAIITALEREPLRSSRDIAREFGLSQPRAFEEVHDAQLESTPLSSEITAASRRSFSRRSANGVPINHVSSVSRIFRHLILFFSFYQYRLNTSYKAF
jgi:hypothetical protein